MIESNQLRVNGLRVQYDTAGNCGSPVLLLIHGWVSSSRMWHTTMAGLSDAFHCVAPDLPGFGESEKAPAGWYALPNYFEFLLEFYEAVGIRHAHVVGHSMGGLLALALAADFPERVDRLVPVNPVVTGRVWRNAGRFADSRYQKPVLAAARALWPVAISPIIAWPVHDRLLSGPGMRRRREDLAKSAADAVLSGIRSVLALDISTRLGAIQAPTLVVIGQRDMTVPPSEGRLAAEGIAGASLISLPTGHVPSDEQPERFVRVVRQFLA